MYAWETKKNQDPKPLAMCETVEEAEDLADKLNTGQLEPDALGVG